MFSVVSKRYLALESVRICIRLEDRSFHAGKILPSAESRPSITDVRLLDRKPAEKGIIDAWEQVRIDACYIFNALINIIHSKHQAFRHRRPGQAILYILQWKESSPRK